MLGDIPQRMCGGQAVSIIGVSVLHTDGTFPAASESACGCALYSDVRHAVCNAHHTANGRDLASFAGNVPSVQGCSSPVDRCDAASVVGDGADGRCNDIRVRNFDLCNGIHHSAYILFITEVFP